MPRLALSALLVACFVVPAHAGGPPADFRKLTFKVLPMSMKKFTEFDTLFVQLPKNARDTCSDQSASAECSIAALDLNNDGRKEAILIASDIAASQVFHSIFVFQQDGKYMMLMPVKGNKAKGEGLEVGITAKQSNGYSRVCFGGGSNFQCLSWKGRNWAR